MRNEIYLWLFLGPWMWPVYAVTIRAIIRKVKGAKRP